MTTAELVIDLKNILGPGVDVDNNGLRQWLNDSYMFIVDEIIKVNPEYFVKAAQAQTFHGQQQYDLPDDFEKIVMVNVMQNGVWVRARPLQNIGMAAVLEDPTLANQYSVGNPVYYLYAKQLGILPVTADDNGLIQIWYVFTPSPLTADSDVPLIPSKYHGLLKLEAQANYLDRDNDHNGAEILRRRFESRVDDLVESANEQQIDEPRSITIEGSDDLYVDNNTSRSY